MRTTITIPDPLIKELLAHSHKKKVTEAINAAIREWLRAKKIQEIKQLRGKLEIEDNLAMIRNAELRKLEQHDE